MAQVFATLRSIGQNPSELHLPLLLRMPDQSSLDLAQCPNVYENGQYEVELTLDFNELEQLLQKQRQEGESKDILRDSLNLGSRLAQHDLGLTPASGGGRLASPDFAYMTGANNTLAASNDSPHAGDDDFFGLNGKSNNNSLRDSYGSFKSILSVVLELNDQIKGYFPVPALMPANQVMRSNLVYSSGTTTLNKQLFLLQYDVVSLCLDIQFSDYSHLRLYSPLMLCASNNKEDNKNINNILNELTDVTDDAILEMMFQQQANKENFDSLDYGSHRAYQSLNTYVSLLQEVISCYKNNFGAFKSLAKHIIVKDYQLQSFEKVRSVTPKSHHWLTQNIEVLQEVRPSDGIVQYNGRHYLPLQMESEVNRISFNTFENRVVVGFLKMVLHNANKILAEYKQFIQQHKSNLDESTAAISKEYQAPIITIKYLQLTLCERELSNLQEAISSLNVLYLNYAKLFNIRDALLQHLPRNAKAFQEIKPYVQVFRVIMLWFRFGDFSLQKESLFLNVKTLDKLFEYYCLYRLLDMLLEQGFEPCAGDKASYTFRYTIDNGSYDYDELVANTYQLRRGRQQVTVYYQPIISTKRFENGIFAYRTNTLTKNNYVNTSNFYSPDFILKFSSGEGQPGDDDYVIFDAKFSHSQNILSYYLDNLIMKYGTNTTVAVLQRKNMPMTATQQQSYGGYNNVAVGSRLHLQRQIELDQESQLSNSASNITANGLSTGPSSSTRFFSNKIVNSKQDNHSELSAYSSSYEFIACKPAKMLFALQGRINRDPSGRSSILGHSSAKSNQSNTQINANQSNTLEHAYQSHNAQANATPIANQNNSNAPEIGGQVATSGNNNPSATNSVSTNAYPSNRGAYQSNSQPYQNRFMLKSGNDGSANGSFGNNPGANRLARYQQTDRYGRHIRPQYGYRSYQSGGFGKDYARANPTSRQSYKASAYKGNDSVVAPGAGQTNMSQTTNMTQTAARSTIHLYHDAPLAQHYPPHTSVGMVEMSTQVDSTPDLWREIIRNIPYLQTKEDKEANT